MCTRHAGRIVLDSALDPDVYGPAVQRGLAPADAAALRNWAGWAARHNRAYGLGDSAGSVLHTIALIGAAARRQPLRVGGYRVSSYMLPGLLLTSDDSDQAYAGLSAEVSELRDAARGQAVTPTGNLAALLALFTDPDVVPELNLSATVASQCADRAACS
jgi:hypothetical protein